MQKKEFMPTYPELIKMGLDDYQINILLHYENLKHGFHDYLKTRVQKYTPPHSLFFLDIKDTIYPTHGHGSPGLLGKPSDCMPISIYDVLAISNLLKGGVGYLDLSYYSFTIKKSNLIYSFPKNKNDAVYKLDLPRENENNLLVSGMSNYFKNNYEFNGQPYKVIFISTDPVETQKRIMKLFLIIDKINTFLLGKIDNDLIVELSKDFEQCDYCMEKFDKILINKYGCSSILTDKEEINSIIDSNFFIQSDDKLKSMKEFLQKYNIENNLNCNDYNIFACGDSYEMDGPMVRFALENNGYGCLNTNNLNFLPCKTETLRRILYVDSGIETRKSLISYGFNDFYNKSMDFLSTQRTWDIAETMSDINNPEIQEVKNRFYKTNHYIKILK